MTKDEALDLALEALELSSVTVDSFDVQRKTQEAITAIKQALAEPVQPVMTDEKGRPISFWGGKSVEPIKQPASASWMEMVTANLVREGIGKHKARELAEHFYSLAQRPWVGLTDEEVMQTMSGDWTSQFYFARAIETKLRSKNNG